MIIALAIDNEFYSPETHTMKSGWIVKAQTDNDYNWQVISENLYTKEAATKHMIDIASKLQNKNLIMYNEYGYGFKPAETD